MFIDINTIGDEGLTFDRSVQLHGLEGPSRESIPDLDARVEGTINPVPGGAELKARVGAKVPLMCSRCLEIFSWDVNMAFAWKVLKASADEDPSVLIAPEGKIGLEDLATEQLYLNLPLKPICSTQCRGLCPSCGTNKNLNRCECVIEEIDPRLAPLLPFRRKPKDS